MYHPSNPHLLVSASHDCSCVVWDLDLKQPIHTLEEHSGYIRHAGWSPCRDYVHRLERQLGEVVDGQSGRRTQTLRRSTNTLYCCCWSPDSNGVAAASRDGSIRVLEAGEDALVVMAGHRSEVRSLAWHPSGDVLCAGCWDGKVSFWNPSTGEGCTLASSTLGQSSPSSSYRRPEPGHRLARRHRQGLQAERGEVGRSTPGGASMSAPRTRGTWGALGPLGGSGGGVPGGAGGAAGPGGVREAVRGLGAASSHGRGGGLRQGGRGAGRSDSGAQDGRR